MNSSQAPHKISTNQLNNGAKFDTIVIGGGIAGVSAAVQLAKHGNKVAILQANNYLGGRLKTTPVKLQSGATVQFDEGASWIHGSNKKHPITQLSKNVDGLVMKQTDDDNIDIYDEKGNNVQKRADEAYQVYQKLLKKCQKKEPSKSMEQAFEQLNKNVLHDKFFMYNVANDVQFQTSGGISKLAANTLDDDQFDGKQMLILSGYQSFVDTLASKATFQIYLNQIVKKVIWKHGQSDVFCANGITISAKNIILAVPIGVLKATGIQFIPNLPNWKNQSINSIGFGNVCKILIDFSDGNMIDTKSHYIGVVSDDICRRGLGTYFLNLKPLAKVPAIMTFGLGDNADEAQNMPQAQLKAFLAKRLSVFTEQDVGPNDFKMYRTHWKNNPNFHGTYSYASTTTRPFHWQNMAKPIFCFNWYFCGEHTISRYRGTVHGAYLSGLNAAKCITHKLNQDNWKYTEYA